MPINPTTAHRYPALRKKCKYCKLEFTTPATANGRKMQFCKAAHRWAFAREGSKPIDFILKKQERRLRLIVIEEIHRAVSSLVAGGVIADSVGALVYAKLPVR